MAPGISGPNSVSLRPFSRGGFAIIRRSPSAPALCVWEVAHERIFYARTAHDPTRAQSTCVFQGYSGGTSPESLFFACVKCASGKIPPGHSWESSLAMCECNESWRAFPASGQCKHAPGISGPDGVSFVFVFARRVPVICSGHEWAMEYRSRPHICVRARRLRRGLLSAQRGGSTGGHRGQKACLSSVWNGPGICTGGMTQHGTVTGSHNATKLAGFSGLGAMQSRDRGMGVHVEVGGWRAGDGGRSTSLAMMESRP